MADELDTTGDEQVEETDETAAAAAEPNPELEAIRTERDNLLKLVTSPDVAAMIKAKETGTQMQVIIGGAKEDEPAEEPFVLPEAAELDEMRPSQVLALALKAQQHGLPKALTEALEPIAAGLASLQEDRSSERKAKIKGEVDGLLTKYPDLPQYKDAIQTLAGDGKMSIAEAYMLARVRAGKSPLPAPKTSTVERPTQFIARALKSDTKPARTGARGYRQDLDEVMAGIEEVSV